MRVTLAGIATALALVSTVSANAACPIGKKEGDKWCEKGMEWKCEKCGSEYCPIITGNKCVKDDESVAKLGSFARSLRAEADLTEFTRRLSGLAR